LARQPQEREAAAASRLQVRPRSALLPAHRLSARLPSLHLRARRVLRQWARLPPHPRELRTAQRLAARRSVRRSLAFRRRALNLAAKTLHRSAQWPALRLPVLAARHPSVLPHRDPELQRPRQELRRRELRRALRES
jgi:hypothetical protein